jgi:anti-sigma B factor antagonist
VKADFALGSDRVGDNTYLVDVGGELDLYTSPRLRSHISGLIAEGAHVVIVDLSEATFIDSSALHVLLGVLRQLDELGGRLAVVCPDGNLRRVFEVTGIDGLIRIYDSPADALDGRQVSALRAG